MLECAIIGDSIAVATGGYMPRCAVYAQNGISSEGWGKRWRLTDYTAGVTLISLGSNDLPKVDTYSNLKDIRGKIRGRVVWIMPNKAVKPAAADAVARVAAEWGDRVITVTGYTADRIHPSKDGYREIIEGVK